MKTTSSYLPPHMRKLQEKSEELDMLQFEEWLVYTEAIQERLSLDAYSAADLAIKFITNRTLQNGLLRGFTDEAILSAVAEAVIDVSAAVELSLANAQAEVSEKEFDLKTD